MNSDEPLAADRQVRVYAGWTTADIPTDNTLPSFKWFRIFFFFLILLHRDVDLYEITLHTSCNDTVVKSLHVVILQYFI